MICSHRRTPRHAPTFIVALALIGSFAACSGSESSTDSAVTTAPVETDVVAPTDTAAPDTAAAESSAPDTVAPEVVMVDPNGIGQAKLGDEPESVIAYFTMLFGAPASDGGWEDVSGCDAPTIREVYWSGPQVRAIFAPWDALGANVAADPQLVWLDYGLVLGVYPTVLLTTDRGLMLGDSVDRLLELYPEATAFDGAYGGRFYRFSDGIVGPNGILDNGADPQTISSIESGDYPCDLMR